MSNNWRIAGQPAGTQPEVGKTYEVRHSRKGTFTVRVLQVDGEWLTGLIVAGTASAAMSYNVRDEGEKITVRDELSYLIPVEEDASPDAKAATLLEGYKVLAEEVRSLAEMEASHDVPDEDIAEAIIYIGRAMRCVAGARAFCVDLCETPKAPRCRVRDLPPDERTDSLGDVLSAPEGWKVKNPDWPQGTEPHLVREDEEEEDDGLPVLNRPSPDRPVRFNIGGIGVWAKTYFEAEQILMDTRDALLGAADRTIAEARTAAEPTEGRVP